MIKKFYLKITGLGILVFAAMLIGTSSSTHAVTKNTGLTISPLRNYPARDPGFTTTSDLTVSDFSETPMEVVLSAETFSVTDEDYDYAFQPVGNQDWIRFSTTNIALGAGQSQTVSYSIAVPSDAKPGGYYFTIFATTKGQPSGTALTEVKRTASLVYLQVNGNISHKLILLGVNAPWITTTADINLSARVTNQGTSHEEATIGIDVLHWPNNNTDASTLKGLVLPSTIRRLNGSLNLGRWPGIYKVVDNFSPPQGGADRTSHTVIYLPIWFDLLLVIALLYAVKKIRLNKKLKRPK